MSDHLSAQRPERKCDVIKILSFSTVSRKIVLTQTKRWDLKMCERRVPGVRVVQTQQQVHLCEFGKIFMAAEPSAVSAQCRTCTSEPVRRLLGTAQREMIRQNATLQYCQYLTIFDPWNRLKTGHLFMLFFPITLK